MSASGRRCTKWPTLSNSELNIATFDITPAEYDEFAKLIYKLASIHLGSNKDTMVSGRLNRRLRHYGLKTFSEYLDIVNDPANTAERQVLVDLLTTNETYFFREPRHFDFLLEEVIPRFGPGRTPRIWSAACSTGEEPYTLAMIMAQARGSGAWEIVATDINQQVLEQARSGLYPMEACEKIPLDCLHKYCLKGVRGQMGKLLIDKQLRNRVRFMTLNLTGEWQDIGEFDVIFLRNVMIYFDQATKRKLVGRMVQRLRAGGYLIVGHSESLTGVCDKIRAVWPSIYRKI